MIQFSKLRLHGFKSFVDKTEIEIGAGLTGIVGPNGCGKSNLVEALRWVMGESSTKRMRGGSRSMEDVIFNGTEKRPARNMAEVSILLDNTAHTAPSPYSQSEEIEVVRKIEKDHGSGYKINGKNVRARDVQMLFADILAGANSPYLVSQGKVANIIQAKPSERKMILEEAAGISGLYARRHEAELRLRATDKNLMRLDDLLGSMEGRLSELKKQARQAARYKNYSAQIRQLEVSIACLEWRIANEKLQDVKRNFAEIESRVAENMTVVTQLTKTQNEQAKDLPDLRQKDAELAAALQSYRLNLQRLEDEEQRLSEQVSEAKNQLLSIGTDRDHEKHSLSENTGLLDRLSKEEKILQNKENDLDGDLRDKEELKTALYEKVEKLENAMSEMLEKSAASKASKDSLHRQIEIDQSNKAKTQERMDSYKAALDELTKENPGIVDTDAMKADIAAQEKALLELKQKAANKRDDLKDARAMLENERETLRHKERELQKQRTEIETLASILRDDGAQEFKPVFDSVTPEKGFEIALSRALGDSLMGSDDDEAPVVWQKRALQISDNDFPALPTGAGELLPHINAPDILKAALKMIGYVDDQDNGHAIATMLKPGQALVSRDGAYWRWDGLFIKATAADRTAQRLQQKNKLAELEKAIPKLEKECASQEKARDTAQDKITKLEEVTAELSDSITAKENEYNDLQRALNQAIERQSEQQAEKARLEEALALAKNDLAALDVRIAEQTMELATFDDAALEKMASDIESKRETLSAAREEYQTALNALEMAKSDHSRRQARLQAIGDERISLQNRIIRAQERLKDLDKREAELTERVETLKKRPAEIKVEKTSLLEKLSANETQKSEVSDRLAVLEGELADTTKALKEAESVLGSAREGRAHALATAEERQKQMDSSKQYIREHFDLTPEELMAEAALDPENLPALSVLKEEREKAVRARDLIGAVNLRAESEAEGLEKELGGILNEKQDLVEAVEELRAGINKLNNEARERLQSAFDHVNGYFREMFTRLFNGGKAHLALIESDDPLEAGLEIFAQPPGKALQSLTLLSGGEQTMTAIALIFAMFLTNPAPICVLDEVDAPLDDANVDRFCDLLEEFAERGETRFLVITHHRLTMARMDRLYGVTMAERGVSKLVSVDLNQQLDFLDAA